VKLVRKKAEEARVGVRNVRREANEKIKQLEKKGELTEDDRRDGQEEIQELTDAKIKRIDELLKAKEEEIMEI